MMDDLLVDFDFLDDDLLSLPMGLCAYAMDDEFNPIETREIESILNEIENSTTEKLFNANAYTFSNDMRSGKLKNGTKNKKSKSKFGTSLLAKPPMKVKKDKNSLLRSTTANNNSPSINRTNISPVCQATFLAYFYQDHDYCQNTEKLEFEQPFNVATRESVDLNNNNSEFKQISLETKEIVIDSNQVLRKKQNSFTNQTSTATLISANLFNNSYEYAHDLNDYFNISFSNSEETDSTSSNHSELDFDVGLGFNLESEMNRFASKTIDQQVNDKEIEKQTQMDTKSAVQTNTLTRTANDTVETIKKDEQKSVDKTNSSRTVSEIKSVLIDDINNYGINELNTDTDNELNSLDDEEYDEADDIEADILIDKMLDEFEEYELIASSKKSKISKNLSSKKINSRILNSNKSAKTVANTNRRTRTISNSYSVRSGSSCSCSSEDLSEEEQHQKLKRADNLTSKHNHQQHIKTNPKSNQRRSISKLIKTDNTFIRKKNNGRFLMHKNTSF